MSTDDQTRQASAVAQILQRSRPRLRGLARRGAWRFARPYARRRARESAAEDALARLQADFEHVSRRHTEQIERLEDLVRELVLTVESLRRARISPTEDAEHD
jgi:hypothetical protein